jgi:deferrochelatase/peroxidase EfeB
VSPDPSNTSDSSTGPDAEQASGPVGRVSRRRLFAGAGTGAVLGVLAGAGAAQALDGDGGPTAAADQIDLSHSYPFYTGGEPAGVATLPQRYCAYMTFDLVAGSARDLQVLLARWSAGIAQLMAGKTIGSAAPTRSGAVATDTGEALDLGPSSLTVTVGLGPGVFDERYGLAGRKPKLLADLPRLPSDSLDPALTGGDLSLQACADDPQVAYHAIRDLARMARGVANTRWTVMGFGRASAGPGQSTPRNLLGFKDGTRNIKESDDRADYVWVGSDDVDWMRGGSYQVARKIQMNVETWDADDITDQQRIFGRTKLDGAPLTGTKEFETPDFKATDSTGATVIDQRSHVALAAPENNNGVKILRRSYNYTDGINQYGQLDAGLLFIAYMSDPQAFITLQTRLGSSDLLNEYIAHIGSGIFAVPPAPSEGNYLAQSLFT